jgi:hypothetical protein
MTLVERFDRTLISTLALALLLSGVALIGWGLLLAFSQCLGWLKFGAWQSVPLYALWLSPTEQFNQLVPLALWDASWGPLMLVPSLADGASLTEVSQSSGGAMAGLVKLLAVALDAPLSLLCSLIGLSCVGGASMASASHLP